MESNTIEPTRRDRRAGWAVAYVVMLGLTVGGFMLIRRLGGGLVAAMPPPAGETFGTPSASANVDALMHVLLALVVIIVTARGLGAVFRFFKQPPVIGEVLAGVLLGPSLLGRVAPDAYAFLLPTSVAPFLSVLSQVGVLLYMFIVGLELDLGVVHKRTHTTVSISHASIVLPFLLGSALALLLYPRMATQDVPFTVFALFSGVAMSVTAFPVLARILTDRQMHRSRVGVIALTCAAVDDVTAWCLLAFVVSVAHTQMGGAVRTLALSVLYLGLVVLVARPLIRRAVARLNPDAPAGKTALTVAFVGVLVSSLATEWIGIHAVFGAFVVGAMIPHDSRLAQDLVKKLEDIVVILFLPAFFAYTGMRTQIGLVSSAAEWLLCGLIIIVASAGKFGGSLVAARLTGLSWRDSAAIGILMNTRGLMELIVLNIGLDLKVISPTLFAMLVIMAVVTTFATTPILHLIAPAEQPELAPDAMAVNPLSSRG